MPNSSDFNHFSVNPVNIDISRSMFNMDHSVKFSCNVGDVVPFDEGLDDGSPCRRRTEADVFHGFAELLVFDFLAAGLHVSQEGCVGVYR